MKFNGLIDALEHNTNYKKDYVEVYGIAYRSWGQSYFLRDVAFDNVDEAFDYFKNSEWIDNYSTYVVKMTYNQHGSIDIGWENGTICYREDVKYK